MVTKTSDRELTVDDLLALWARVRLYYRSRVWNDVHSISGHAVSNEMTLGLANQRWLPPADKWVLARLVDWADREKDPKLLLGVASILQRAATGDPEFEVCLRRLSSLVEDLGNVAPGRALAAVQAEAELDRLLAVGPGRWSTVEEVLEEEHSLPRDLLNLAWWRLPAKPSDWREVLTVIYRLRKAMGSLPRLPPIDRSNDPFFQKYRWTRRLCVTLGELFILIEWIERNRLSGDDLEAVKAWFLGLDKGDA